MKTFCQVGIVVFMLLNGVLLRTLHHYADVPFRFLVRNVAEHYHLPFKFTAWGFSLFRGGA